MTARRTWSRSNAQPLLGVPDSRRIIWLVVDLAKVADSTHEFALLCKLPDLKARYIDATRETLLACATLLDTVPDSSFGGELASYWSTLAQNADTGLAVASLAEFVRRMTGKSPTWPAPRSSG